MGECTVGGCHRGGGRLGLCRKHLQRQRRTGSPEGTSRLSTAERFWVKVDKNGPIPAHRPELGPCWIWTASTARSGYGQFQAGKRGDSPVLAHRWAYQESGGLIPDDRPDLDHLCHPADGSCPGGQACPHRACVNPAHLEPVTGAENTRRGLSGENMRRITHCPQDHEYTPENTIINSKGSRICRKCRDISNRKPRAPRKREVVAA